MRMSSGSASSTTAYAPFSTLAMEEFGRFGNAWRVRAMKVGMDLYLDNSKATLYAPDVSLPSAGRMTVSPGIMRRDGTVSM
eukprot:1536563-Pyramimonas_sp.AAC.1